MRSSLLRVIVDQFPDVRLDDLDLRENLVCGGSPLERLRIVVPVGNVVLDPFDQYCDRCERTPSDGLTSYYSEPGLHLVEPG